MNRLLRGLSPLPLAAVLLQGCFSFSVDPELQDCYQTDCPTGEACSNGACSPIVAPPDADTTDAQPPADACLEGCGVPQAPICDTNPSEEVLAGLVELCGNELDDDCDNTLDEGDDSLFYQPDPNDDSVRLGPGDPCTLGEGLCAAEGVVVCDPGGQGASLTCDATPGEGAEEQCNGLDDDCDGRTDEGIPGVGAECVSGLGPCAQPGTTYCTPEGTQVCDAEPLPAGVETCEGSDEDCDGTIDEDFQIGEPCALDQGVCQQEGAYRCTPEQDGSICALPEGAEPIPPGVELCDGALDEDCDGAVDEDFAAQLGQACAAGVGACLNEGLYICGPDGTATVCGVEPGEPAEHDRTCDGVDDDCDGTADENFLDDAITPFCGVGACQNIGTIECVEGEPVEDCEPREPAETDSICDGQDEDCDGSLDEDYAAVGITCGLGVCEANGIRLCNGGAEQDNCLPGLPTAESGNDFQCNNQDEDCDGANDEDFIGDPTQCGVGACRRQATTVCVGNQVVDPCVPGEPAPTDETCDGIDDDCDGRTDENVPQVQTRCGLGACVAEGVLLCFNGAPLNTCQPITPRDGEADVSCDGVDNDCDGVADEGYQGERVECGGNQCGPVAELQCVDGEIRSLCRNGIGIPEGQNCNGVDEDCDGVADEDFEPGEACEADQAFGICKRGRLVCTGSGAQCRPRPPAEEVCEDNEDNDCDGTVDEECPVAR